MSAKLTVNHDYLTLRVTLAPNSRVNLTVNRWGVKLTATMDHQHCAEEMIEVFDKVYKTAKMKPGELMDLMQKKMDSATTAEDVLSVLKSLIGNSKSDTEKAPKAVETTGLIKVTPPPAKTGGKDYTREELQAAFDKVKNKKDWKARIDRTISIEDLNVTMAAITYFQGCIPYEVAHANPAKVVVRSAGYIAN